MVAILITAGKLLHPPSKGTVGFALLHEALYGSFAKSINR